MVRVRMTTIRRLYALVFVFAITPSFSETTPSLDVSKGEIDGRVAIAFLPVKGFEGRDLMDPQAFEVRLAPVDALDQELARPAGKWFQVPPGKYKYWLDLAPYPGVIARASFPHSFGYWVDAIKTKTIMTIRGGLGIALSFSNPDIVINGYSLGVLGEADNSLTIELLAPIAAEFRERDLLHADGFESGDLSRWSFTVGF